MKKRHFQIEPSSRTTIWVTGDGLTRLTELTTGWQINWCGHSDSHQWNTIGSPNGRQLPMRSYLQPSSHRRVTTCSRAVTDTLLIALALPKTEIRTRQFGKAIMMHHNDSMIKPQWNLKSAIFSQRGQFRRKAAHDDHARLRTQPSCFWKWRFNYLQLF